MRARHTTAIALAASAACHATLVGAAMWFGTYEPVAPPRGYETAIITPVLPPEDPLGARHGLGEAVADFEAEEGLRSPHEAQDQPLLGLVAPGPLRAGLPTQSELLAAAEPRPAMPVALTSVTLAEALRAGTDTASAVKPPDALAVQAPEPLAIAPAEQAPAERPMATSAAPTATDPGPAAGREVDLFSKEASADYRAGRAVARSGRDFKLRGLRRGLSAMVEQAFLPRPIVVSFRIKLDAEGNPLDVKVEKSSGSVVLDQTLRKDLYNSWFDPDPAGDGTDTARPFLFTLRIQ